MIIQKKIKIGSFRLLLILSTVFFLLFTLALVSQKSIMQSVPDDKSNSEAEKEIKKQEISFWKVSSSQSSSDEGNKIAAIRRIKLKFDDVDSKGFDFMNMKEIIEIEIFSKVPIPVTNSAQYIIIGDRIFPEPAKSANGQTVFVHLNQKEFDDLRDQSVVSYVISSVGFGREAIKRKLQTGRAARNWRSKIWKNQQKIDRPISLN